MARFIFKNKKVIFVVRPRTQSVIPNPKGVPMLVDDPGRTITVENGELVTKDQEVIDRIRSDSRFGTEFIREITEADEEAIKIRNKKAKEAEEEIKSLKK